MARPLRELRELAETHDATVVYAGDIFDRWNAGPEVINFALKHMPKGYAVPGQHDLPNHSYTDIRRGAYWTLVEAGLIQNLTPDEPVFDRIIMHGFPWGHPPAPITPDPNQVNLAVVHAFIYDKKSNAYQGASTRGRASVARVKLAGFDVAVYGDNHKGFTSRYEGLTIFNCGGFMRRNIDQRDYRPSVGLLLGTGEVVRHYLDTTEEKFRHRTEAETALGLMDTLDTASLIEDLNTLGADDSLEFEGALRRFLKTNKTEAAVRKIVLEAATT